MVSCLLGLPPGKKSKKRCLVIDTQVGFLGGIKGTRMRKEFSDTTVTGYSSKGKGYFN